MFNMEKIVEIDKIYNYFDDGKIRESRRIPVKIIEIIPFNDIDPKILNMWKEEVKDCYWLYAKETDYFIKGSLQLSKFMQEPIYFVRTLSNEWFSLGWWGGQLDVDGSLTKSLS